jgi:hypothetical protein
MNIQKIDTQRIENTLRIHNPNYDKIVLFKFKKLYRFYLPSVTRPITNIDIVNILNGKPFEIISKDMIKAVKFLFANSISSKCLDTYTILDLYLFSFINEKTLKQNKVIELLLTRFNTKVIIYDDILKLFNTPSATIIWNN